MAKAELTQEVVEQTANNIEQVAEVTRNIDVRAIRFFLGGIGLGTFPGFLFGYKFGKQKTRAEILARADREIEEMREVYRQKKLADENTAEKSSVEAIIAERGYVVMEDATLEEYTDKLKSMSEATKSMRPTKSPVPIIENPSESSITGMGSPTQTRSKDKNVGWNSGLEMSRRSPDRPHVIHQDEYEGNESGFSQVDWTYYTIDGVLTDENEVPVPNGEAVLGAFPLPFGHGSDDMDVVYIRNPELQIEFEVTRVPRIFDQNALGLSDDSDSDSS